MNNSIDAIKSAARILRDEAGNVVVQLPLEMWDTLLQQIQPIPQHERLKALLLLWEAEGDTGLDDEWDRLDRFLRNNRLKLSKRDMDLSDE